MFDAFLDRLSLPADRLAEISMPSRLEDAGLGQLYQTLDWLQPSSSATADQQEAWSSLQGKLHRIGPRPTPTKRYHGGNSKLCSALEQLQLSFRAKVVIQSYGAHAVIESQGNKAQPIILSLGSPDYIRNIPGRLVYLPGCSFPLKVYCQHAHMHAFESKPQKLAGFNFLCYFEGHCSQPHRLCCLGLPFAFCFLPIHTPSASACTMYMYIYVKSAG